MKNLMFLLFIYGCTPKEEVLTPDMGRSIWPSTLELGSDIVSAKTDSICLCEYSSYLSTCGMAPETEAPDMGVEVYQIGGNPATISWQAVSGKTVPIIKGLEPGQYSFAGHLWLHGYRTCDSTYQNTDLYDTIHINILKRKKLGNNHNNQR